MVDFTASKTPSHRVKRGMRHPLLAMSILMLVACGGSTTPTATPTATTTATTTAETTTQITPEQQAVFTKTFGAQISTSSYANYAGASIPAYIIKSNAGNVENAKATLGRVLFYDKKLSIDDTVSCASCHQQSLAFSDGDLASKGVQGGVTGRHSMRLINTRFAEEARFFWDKRATTLEAQVLQPIQDHNEMGFSGTSGRPVLADLLVKLAAVDYYQVLFKEVYGDTNVTAARVQESLTHFVRSIVSFDSKFDAGRAQAANDNQNFANFTAQENTGKNLFLTRPVFDANGVRTSGGLGCNGCHRSPEFDIDPNSRNNGIIRKLDDSGFDLTNTRAPTLRDLAKPDGSPNSPMMHTGNIATLQAVIGHYGTITVGPNNNNLDARLRPNGVGQQLQLTAPEVNAVIAFLKTLTGTAVYTDAKWSDPFIR
jgi:cytochrome c peroxidase